jgi:hypothetical protein
VYDRRAGAVRAVSRVTAGAAHDAGVYLRQFSTLDDFIHHQTEGHS